MAHDENAQKAVSRLEIGVSKTGKVSPTGPGQPFKGSEAPAILSPAHQHAAQKRAGRTFLR